MFSTKTTVLSTLLGYAAVWGAVPGSTLQDCENFASQFANTCSSTSSSVNLANHAGATMSCVGDDIRCPEASGKANYTS